MLRNQRSGSSSSVISGQSSYGGQSESSFVRSKSRPSLDETRAGSSLGKSPLGESVLSAQSSSGHDLSAGANSPYGQAAPAGRSSSEAPRRVSEDRLGDGMRRESNLDNGDGASTSGGRRRPSNEGMRSIAEDELNRPSSRNDPRREDGGEPPRPSRRVNGEKPKPSAMTTTQNLGPTITTTLPSPSFPPPPPEPQIPSPVEKRPQRRKSFHPAPINTAFSREVLLTSRTGVLPGAAGLTVEGDKNAADEALLNNVEEMLEGFDWTAGVGAGGRKKGSADVIESRLLDELAALDSVSQSQDVHVHWYNVVDILGLGEYSCFFGIG